MEKIKSSVETALSHPPQSEFFNPLDYPGMFTRPRRLIGPFSWVEHIPFVMFLVEVLEPRVIVELGVHSGISYCAMCQSVQQNRLDTRCYGIDTWQGDEQGGFYGPEILADLRDHHDPLYGGFSRLIQSTFDEALTYFIPGTVDLLHIDGYHTYTSVKHDFETWLPSLGQNGVIILHDTNVRENNFGVWKFWSELVAKYPTFEFLHCHGLGVLALSLNQPEPLKQLFYCSGQQAKSVSTFFYEIGSRLKDQGQLAELHKELNNLNQAIAERDQLLSKLEGDLAERDQLLSKLEGDLAERDQLLNKLEGDLAERDQLLNKLEGDLAERDQLLNKLEGDLAERDQLLSKIENSTSWRLTKPIRRLSWIKHT